MITIVKHSDNIVTFNSDKPKDSLTISTNLFRSTLQSMDFPHSLTLAFQQLGISSREAKAYVALLQKAGVEKMDDLKCKFTR